jgi:hypothetical protein
VVCDDPVCCPEQGRRWTSPASSRISLEATIAGFPVPLADRQVLRERVEPDDVLVADVGRLVFGATRPAARSLPGSKPVGAGVVAAAVQAFGRTRRCGLDERAEVLGALMLGREREEAVRLLLAAGAAPDAPPLPDQQRWWELLCRSAPEELVPAPAALAALAAALCGEGAMANIAVEVATRALEGWHEGVETMPEHPQAMLVANTSALVRSGLPPERLRDLLATVYLRSGAEGDLRRDAAG